MGHFGPLCPLGVKFPLTYVIIFISRKGYVWIGYLFVSHSMINMRMPKPCMTIILVTVLL
jgi:hypothetical protein